MTTSSSAREPLPAGAGPNGWIAFAGIVLFLNGFFSALYGLTAVLNPKAVTVGGQGVVVWDFTAWGWIAMVLGVAMVVIAVGLFTGHPLARWAAVVFAGLDALAQFGTAPAFPLWSLLVITLNVVVIYQLVVRWQLED